MEDLSNGVDSTTDPQMAEDAGLLELPAATYQHGSNL